MWRISTISALILALNVCPFVCLGAHGDVGTAVESAASCACCSGHATPAGIPTEQPSQQEGCDCVCEGAILAEQAEDAVDLSTFDPIGLVPLLTAPLSLTHNESNDCGSPGAAKPPDGRFSGSSLRAIRI